MWQDIAVLKDFLFATLDHIVLLYFSGGILSAVFAIYIVRKVSKLIDKLR
jgi:hypothetical protein